MLKQKGSLCLWPMINVVPKYLLCELHDACGSRKQIVEVKTLRVLKLELEMASKVKLVHMAAF